jgi:SET domain-containing protein
MKEKLELCNATERTRIAFGKSGIHGWGLFARVPMRQDSMVTEYRWVQVQWVAVQWCAMK